MKEVKLHPQSSDSILKSQILKRFLKRFLILFIALGIVGTILVGGGIYLKAKVKSEIRTALDNVFEPQIEEANIRLSFTTQFPNPYLFIKDLRITHQTDTTSTEVLGIEHAGVSLDFWSLVKGRYAIKEAKIQNAEVLFFANEEGQNIRLFKYKKRDSTAAPSPLELNLPQLTLENIFITNHNLHKGSDWHLHITQADFEGAFKEGKLNLEGNLDGVLDSLAKNGDVFLKDKSLNVQTGFEFDSRTKTSRFYDGKINFGDSKFELDGSMKGQYPDGSLLDLKISTKNDFASLFGFLPENIKSHIQQVNRNAESDFELRFFGLAGPRHNAQMEADFVVNQATIVSSKYPVRIDSLNFAIHYSNGAYQSPISSKLVVDSLIGILNEKPLFLDLALLNFDTPRINMAFDLNIDFNDIQSLISIPGVQQLGGQLALSGNINGVKGGAENNKLSTTLNGNINFEEEALIFDKTQFNFNRLSGTISIQDSILNFKNLKGDFTNIPFRLSGNVENTYRLFYDNSKTLKFNIKAHSNSINLNDVFTEISAPTKSGKRKAHPLTVPDYLEGTLSLNGSRLKYRDAVAQRFETKLTLKNGAIIIPKMSMDVLHGHLSLDARLERKNKNYFDLKSNINLGNLNTKRLLEIFKDFGQNVLTSKQVEGRLSGNITLTALVDKNLDLPGNDIAYYGKYSLDQAELIDFEPIVKALKAIKKKEASHVHINNLEGKAVYHQHELIIPEMSFQSNISDMTMYGIRSPNEEMDFYFEFSLGQLLFKSKKRKKKEREGKKEKKDGIMDMRINLIGKPGDMKVKTRNKKNWEQRGRVVQGAYLVQKKKYFKN